MEESQEKDKGSMDETATPRKESRKNDPIIVEIVLRRRSRLKQVRNGLKKLML